MVRVLTRDEFLEYFLKILKEEKGPLSPYHPILVPEQAYGFKCNWFVEVFPINIKKDYFEWCANTLKGNILCYSSGITEWWGFVEYNDISIWILKWT